MSTMGVGTNILGYCNEEVDNAVQKAISHGNMSSLNCEEEVILAERLVELHPWSEMVRFARTGGEANAMAVRIARAASGREKIAVCGYHGWHDWYLASNLGDNSRLEEHLLPGLDPIGVPSSLAGLTIPFSYNKIDQIEKIVKENELAAIKMEVERSIPPKPGFLEAVREICNKNSIVLIFDECTSGLRETFGGLHKKYNVNPDIAIFGKSLGNGYAITAVLGKSSVMQAAQSTFMSSTFWTERIGPTAGIKTLEIMERERSWETISKSGNEIKTKWINAANKYNLQIKVYGIDSLASFTLEVPEMNKYKTYITQEMLKKGYLASTTLYSSLAHTAEMRDEYINILSKIFKIISESMNSNGIDDLLEVPVCQSGFKRLN